MVFTLARMTGLFALSQHITRKQLRVLCYHGMSVGDQHVFMPFLFMRAATFENRLRVLKKRGVAVVSLDEGLARLRQGTNTNAETVITIDDGWKTTLTIAAPLLKKYGFPACLYITTEHLESGADVFNVVLQYLIWRSKHESLVLKNVHPALDGTYNLRESVVTSVLGIIDAARRNLSLDERQRALAAVAEALEVDLVEVLREGRFGLIDENEIRGTLGTGIDIQLHTHTHQLPEESFEAMRAEIETNRTIVERILGGPRNHFCYPSGKYHSEHPAWLGKLGVASATTCDAGMNDPTTPLLLMKRYLDRDDFSDLEFEAEIAGFTELARKAKAGLRKILGKSTAATSSHAELH